MSPPPARRYNEWFSKLFQSCNAFGSGALVVREVRDAVSGSEGLTLAKMLARKRHGCHPAVNDEARGLAGQAHGIVHLDTYDCGPYHTPVINGGARRTRRHPRALNSDATLAASVTHAGVDLGSFSSWVGSSAIGVP